MTVKTVQDCLEIVNTLINTKASEILISENLLAQTPSIFPTSLYLMKEQLVEEKRELDFLLYYKNILLGN